MKTLKALSRAAQRGALLFLLVVLASTAQAQLAGTISDARLERTMQRSGLKYTVKKNGNVGVVYNVDSTGARTHEIVISSRTESIDKFEVRECRLYAGVLDRLPEQKVLAELMQESFTRKIGSWEMDYSDGKYYIFFNMKIPVDILPEDLRSILGASVGFVDKREIQLTNGKDDY